MLDNILQKLIHRMQSKLIEAWTKWHGTICPKIRKKLEKNADFLANCAILSAGGGIFSVSLMKPDGQVEQDYIVDITTRTCDCRRWQLSGIPCNHAIACFREDNIDPESMVHHCYIINAYMDAYGYQISPMRDSVHWQKMNGTFVYPPLYTKVMGRPKRCRKKSPEEIEKNGAKKTQQAWRDNALFHMQIY
jgi:hypothetical protein